LLFFFIVETIYLRNSSHQRKYFFNSETKKLFDSLAIRVLNKREIRASEWQFILTWRYGYVNARCNHDHVKILKILNLYVDLSGIGNGQTLSKKN
jgi:hypothetical protein